jgi:hypothetical protein
MTIDVLASDLCLLDTLLDSLPRRPSTTCVWRWHRRGVRGRRLQVLKIAGRLHTTRSEFRDFITAIQDPSIPRPTRDEGDVAGELQRAGYTRSKPTRNL